MRSRVRAAWARRAELSYRRRESLDVSLILVAVYCLELPSGGGRVRDLLDRARAETGLENFGDDSFREGLEILSAALRSEARLNARGEAYIYPRIVGHLSQRLRVEDWYARIRQRPGYAEQVMIPLT